MAFPQPNSDWPPLNWQYWYDRYIEWGSWYSGDPERLANYYSSKFPDTEKGRFWASLEREERRTMVHMPIAGDIGSTSADLLFSEVPDIQYKENESGGDRIKRFLEDNEFFNILIEGAEMSAALSGLFLKLDTDPELMATPIVSVVTPYHALPEFHRGLLTAVTFWSEVKTDGRGKVWRLFEDRRRENGQLAIRYKLFEGREDKTGREVELNSIEETATLGLKDVTYNMDGLGTVYIPNMRPNRLQPGSPLGTSDYQGCIGLMDSLDETWSSLMRDIRLGLARILVDEEFLDEDGKFDIFHEVFVKLKMGDLRISGEKFTPIQDFQFDIRVDEHLRAIENLTAEIVSRAGYNPQTFGFSIEGRAESGTALNIRERKSLLTREKKSRYWQPAIRILLEQMQQMDVQAGLTSGYTPQEVHVILQDSIVPDDQTQSETLRNLDQAKAISTYMKVKRLNPDWPEDQIMEEVDRIQKEQGAEGMPFPGLS